MNLKPIFRYRLANNLRGVGVFFGIMALIMAAAIIGFTSVYMRIGNNVSGSFSAYGFASAVALFVFGITAIREDVRLALQNGTSRLTVFSAEVLSLVATAVILAAAGEALTALGQALTKSYDNLRIVDIFQLLFWQSSTESGMTFLQHAGSAACMTAMFICADLAGMFLSLIFYRLNKGWTITVAIAGPLLIFNGLPFLIYKFSGFFFPIGKFIVGSPQNFVLSMLLAAMITGAFNWLLLRHAPVKAAK
ncbi:MAG: hypothetical protein AB7C97_02260 [Oscillospiraceae bacterium]